jgi:hypothetical protein
MNSVRPAHCLERLTVSTGSGERKWDPEFCDRRLIQNGSAAIKPGGYCGNGTE